MDTHVFFLIIRNEMKLQMRSWVFRFFVVLSLVGVVVCQMYRQGGDDIHWKMVGLPCSFGECLFVQLGSVSFSNSHYVGFPSASGSFRFA